MERMVLQSQGSNNEYGSVPSKPVPLSVDLAMGVKRSMNSYGRVLAWVVVMLVCCRIAVRFMPSHETPKPVALAAPVQPRYCEDVDAGECARLAAPNTTTGELPVGCQPGRGDRLASICPRSCGNCAVVLSDCKVLKVLDGEHCVDGQDKVGEICANDGDSQTQSYCTWATKGSGTIFRGAGGMKSNRLQFECAMCADTTMTPERRVIASQLAEGIKDEQGRVDQNPPQAAVSTEVENRIEAVVDAEVQKKLQEEIARVDEHVDEKVSEGTAFVNAKMDATEQRLNSEIGLNAFRGGKGRRMRQAEELATIGLTDLGYEEARENTFIPGYYGARELYFPSLREALEACNGYIGCGGVTLEDGVRYSLRRGTNYAPSPSLEVSWLRKANPWRQQAGEVGAPAYPPSSPLLGGSWQAPSSPLPGGSWQETARDVAVRPLMANERGPGGKTFELQATLRRADGGWQRTSSRFNLGDSFENDNGSLVLGS